MENWKWDEEKQSIYRDINYEAYYRKGYRAVIFDVDNTLVYDNANTSSRARALISRLKEIGFKCYIVSNNSEERVAQIAKELDLRNSYISNAHKPSSKNVKKAMENMGTKPEETIFIGDQFLDDVRAAKKAGCYSILVRPLDPYSEPIPMQFKRMYEKWKRKTVRKDMGDEGKRNELIDLAASFLKKYSDSQDKHEKRFHLREEQVQEGEISFEDTYYTGWLMEKSVKLTETIQVSPQDICFCFSFSMPREMWDVQNLEQYSEINWINRELPIGKLTMWSEGWLFSAVYPCYRKKGKPSRMELKDFYDRAAEMAEKVWQILELVQGGEDLTDATEQVLEEDS